MVRITKVTLLGTGTSNGVPTMGCACKVCSSMNFMDKRYRTSAMVEFNDETTLLIDCGPDFRKQALSNNIKRVDGVLLTHAHADHCHGLPELAVFRKDVPIPVYCNDNSEIELKERFGHLINIEEPIFEFVNVSQDIPFGFIPIPVFHGTLPIIGFRWNNFAYITDCSSIPPETYDLLEGVETLVLNTLNEDYHSTHFSHQQSAEAAMIIGAKRNYFVHLTHKKTHDQLMRAFNNFPKKPDQIFEIGYDGLEIYF